MARTVALWRCKCGTRIKVVAEANFTPPATQTVSCPICRVPHPIHADKIISVTEDKPEGAAISCMEKERLLVLQNKAFDTYRRMVSELADAVGTMAHAEFEFLAGKARAAQEFFVEIRHQLTEHTAKHGC